MKSTKAFTLLEVLLAAAIAMVVLYAMIAPLERWAMLIKWNDEKKNTQAIVDLMQDSLVSYDPALNVSVSANYPWASGTANNTSMSTDISPYLNNLLYTTSCTVQGSAWFGKLAKLRGIYATEGDVYSETNDSDLRRMVINGYNMQRLVLTGPLEAGVQRYLVISVALPPSRGVIWPDYDGTPAYFNEIWNNAWGIDSTVVPASWTARIGTSASVKWNSIVRGSTNASRVIVTKIALRKYTLSINNNHLTNSCWCDWDGRTNNMASLPSSGVTASAVEILSGRRVQVRQGVGAPGTMVMDFPIKETTSVTVQ